MKIKVVIEGTNMWFPATLPLTPNDTMQIKQQLELGNKIVIEEDKE